MATTYQIAGSQNPPLVVTPYMFGAIGDGVTDDTAALQATLDYLIDYPDNVQIEWSGDFLTGALDFPTEPVYIIRLNGTLTLKAGVTLNLPPYAKFSGTGNKGPSQFGMNSQKSRIIPSSTSDPVVRLIYGNITFEHITIDSPPGVGLLIWGGDYGDISSSNGALFEINNVSCAAEAANANSIPCVVDGAFWVNFDRCDFSANPTGQNYSLVFQNTVTTAGFGGYTGIVNVYDTRFNYKGVFIESTTNGSSLITTEFYFFRTIIENMLNGGSMFVLDSSNGKFINSVTIVRPVMADSAGTAYYLKAIGTVTYNVLVEQIDFLFPLLHPSSEPIQYLDVRGNRSYPYSTATSGVSLMYPAYIDEYSRQFGGGLDARLITGQRWPSHVIYAPLDIEQNPASWPAASAGGSKTTGQIGPDGSTFACTIGGTDGGYVSLTASAISAPSLGDWFIAGVWVQSTESGKRPNYADFILAGASPPTLNELSSTINVYNEATNVLDGSWQFSCLGMKVTTAGSGNVTPTLKLWYLETYGGITNYFMPGVIYIPASAGFTDYDVMNFVRTTKGWQSSAKAGEVATLRHQPMRVGAVRTNVPVTVTDAAYTMLAYDSDIICNRAGTVTITLLSAASCPGHEVTIRTITANTVVSASTNVVPLAGGAAAADILAAGDGNWARLKSDGTNWQIMSAN